MTKNKTSNDLTLENIRLVIKGEVRNVVRDELKPVNIRLGGLKEEIRDVVKEERVSVNERLSSLENNLKEARQEWEERFNKMTIGIDKLLRMGKKHEEEHAANQAAHDRFQNDIDYLKKSQSCRFRPTPE